MFPPDLINTLKAYALTQKALPTTAIDPVNSGSSPFEQGQQLHGNVLAEVSPGIFKVRVATQLLQMSLPSNIRPGDSIELQVVSLQPRLTFSLIASANPLSTPEQLSATSRLLSSLSQQQPEKALVHAPQSSLLWPSKSVPQPQQLSGQLREALTNSGLFYESHQAQWLTGSRSTNQLLQEPQNQPAQPPSSHMTNTAEAPHLPGSPTSQPDRIPQHLQALVQQQLNALETNQVLWQGHAWPGQVMQWEIHEHMPQTPDMETARQWVTQLHLDLPNLGEVTATLRFNQAGIILTLQAATDGTRAVLGNASSQLIASLTQAGIPVISAMVAQHESPKS